MTFSDISLAQTHQFSALFLDYCSQNPILEPFYAQKPTKEGFKMAIENKNFSNQKREILHQELKNQYKNANIECSEKTNNNINLLLNENTFTVTTGHQICLMTGPMYFIFKIITTINLAKKLKETYPNHHFVPVYWMATEDHDFEEINHFFLHTQKISWQTNQQGAVGRFSTEGLEDILKSQTHQHPWSTHYDTQSNLADATLSLVNAIFESEGLVIINPDNAKLKSIFIPTLKNDIFSNTGFEKVTQQSNKLATLGYKQQVNPRPINVFYLKDNSRERIVFENNLYQVLNSNNTFTPSELAAELESFPDRFSPNVVLRPLYQETILPNIAYIGGPGELTYWLQLKSLFEAQKIEFPILVPRNFYSIITNNIASKINKLGLQYKDFFKQKSDLKKYFLSSKNTDTYTIENEKKNILENFYHIKSEIIKVDASLEGFANAQLKEIENIFANIDKKISKANELKEHVQLTQIDTIMAKLFPNDTLQERHENILNYIDKNPHLLQYLIKNFDPFSYKFNIIILE